jgi:hypothetical protein
VTLKLRALLNEIEDPAVESALRAVNDLLVDGAVETIALHVTKLERRNRELELLFQRFDGVLNAPEGGSDAR